MRRARELDPLFAMRYAISSQVAFQAGDSALAIEYARHAIALDPDFWIGHFMLAQAHEQLGQTDLALDVLTPAARFSGSNSKALSLRGYVLAKIGRPDEARELLATLETVSRQRYMPPYTFALIHAGLGEPEAVFDWLERAYAARDVHLVLSARRPQVGSLPQRSPIRCTPGALRLHAHRASGACDSVNRVVSRSPEAYMPRALSTLACVCCVLVLAVTASAQPAHQLSGVVRDSTGGVLSGVSISVAGATLVSPRSVATDMQGRYLIELPVGRYLVTATLSGFEPQDRRGRYGPAVRRRSIWCLSSPRSRNG